MTCRIGLLGLLVVIAVVGCQRPGGPPSAQAGEFKKFEGTWVVTAAKLDGDDLPDQVGQEYTFAAGKLTLRQGARVLDTAEVVLDPSARPKAVDLVSDHRREGEPPARFIYEFDGEVLRLCRGDQERPTAFAGQGQVVFTLTRKR